jgi:hypothetical protein
MKKSLLLIPAFLLLSVCSLLAQGGDTERLDTVHLAYRFSPGQRVTYRVVSQDTIIMLDSTKRMFASERVEIVEYRCDTVLVDGYVMTMTLKDFAATESLNGMSPVTRVTHPWVGREVTFLMSPTGQRVNLLELSKEQGVAPGGPFAPLLLPPLGDSVSHVGASGSRNHEYWLFDNVYPPVYWKGATFRVIPRRQKTPAGEAIVISLSDVASVAYKLPGTQIISQTIVNGAGNYHLSPERGYITGGVYELIGKITMKVPSDRTITGTHKIRTTFEMAKSDE